MREGLRLVEDRETAEAGKLEALRAAAQLGISAIERGEFKEFANGSALTEYLGELADRIGGRTKSK